MESEILNILSGYGVEAVVIALIINLLTNLLKKPVKAYSKKSRNNINKYISLFPIALGFICSTLFYGFTAGWSELVFESVFTLGVSSATLSLAIFTVFEKFLIKDKGWSIGTESTTSVKITAETAKTDNLNNAPNIIPPVTKGIKLVNSDIADNQSYFHNETAETDEQASKIVLTAGGSCETEIEKT